MVPASVKVEIDTKEMKNYIKQQLDKQIQQNLLLVDINKLSELLSMSPRYLEDTLLCDPRVKMHERRKNRKRWWLYEPVVKAILAFLLVGDRKSTRLNSSHVSISY